MVGFFFIDGRLRLKCDDTRAETRFRLSAKRTSPFESAGASVQSTTGSRGVHLSGSNAGYTKFRGSVKSTGYPLHSPVFTSLPLPCVTVCHHVSTGLYRRHVFMTSLMIWHYWTDFLRSQFPVAKAVPHFLWNPKTSWEASSQLLKQFRTFCGTRRLLGKPVSRLLKQFRTFCGTRIIIAVFQEACHWSLMHPVHDFVPSFHKIHFNIIL